MGSEVTHEVKGHPPRGQRSPYGGSKVHPMGSMGSDITLWDPMGSKLNLWGQTPFYGIKRHPMGSEVPLWGQRSPYGVKGRPMGSEVTLWALYIQDHPMESMGSHITLWDL